MPRPATGLNTVSRRRPDGGRDFEWYHRATGALIGRSRDGMTKERAAEIARQLSGEPTKSGPPDGSFGALCALYLSSQRFKKLKPKTQKEYRRHIERLRGMWEKIPARGITKAVVAKLHADMAATPWEANSTLRTLRVVLGYGVDKELLQKNAAEGPELYDTRPRTQMWDQPRIDAFLEAAPPGLRVAFALMLYTVQRPSDVLEMAKGRVVEREGDDGRRRLWIALRQAKTDALLLLPCHERLEAELRAAPKTDSLLLAPSPKGLPWAYRNFARTWDRVRARANWRLARAALRTSPLPPREKPKAREEAKKRVRERMLHDLQRRDLRRTGMVMMAIAGATTAQIAAVSGHSIDQTQRILDTYIPRRPEVALGAIEAWERGDTKVVALAPARAPKRPA